MAYESNDKFTSNIRVYIVKTTWTGQYIPKKKDRPAEQKVWELTDDAPGFYPKTLAKPESIVVPPEAIEEYLKRKNLRIERRLPTPEPGGMLDKLQSIPEAYSTTMSSEEIIKAKAKAQGYYDAAVEKQRLLTNEAIKTAAQQWYNKHAAAITAAESFNIGDKVQHSKFGIGVVEKIVDDQITVRFGPDKQPKIARVQGKEVAPPHQKHKYVRMAKEVKLIGPKTPFGFVRGEGTPNAHYVFPSDRENVKSEFVLEDKPVKVLLASTLKKVN